MSRRVFRIGQHHLARVPVGSEAERSAMLSIATEALPVGVYFLKNGPKQHGGFSRVRVVEDLSLAFRLIATHEARFLPLLEDLVISGWRFRGEFLSLFSDLHAHPNPLGCVLSDYEPIGPVPILSIHHGDFCVGALAPMARRES